MNGPHHYREAEKCLRRSCEEYNPQVADLLVDQAQVHAALALAAATAASTLGRHGVPSGEWQEVMR